MSENIQATLYERQKTNGDYCERACITQELKEVMRSYPGWERLDKIERESLEMFAHKISRILAGNPHFDDHWRDIAGYAQLIVNQLQK